MELEFAAGWCSRLDERIYSFAPVEDGSARVLILGTMPSAASLDAGFYYAHPRNCFWPMLAGLLGEDVPETVEAKRAMLTRHGIAVWDVARSCVRPGSLDGDIRDAVANDVAGLLARNPGVGAVLLNGGTAARLYRRLLPALKGRLREFEVPSTSPAYTKGAEWKAERWGRALREALGGG